MSGFEIVPLVLAGLSATIKTVGSYDTTKEFVDRARDAPRGFKVLAMELRAVSTLFKNTVRTVVRECVSPEKLTALVDDMDEQAWADPDVKAAIKEHLKDSYASWIEEVEHINYALNSLNSELEPTPNGKAPVKDASRFDGALARIGFARKSPRYSVLILDMIRHHSTLSDLTEQSKTLRKTAGPKIPNLETIRQGAANLHSSLQRALQSSCLMPHQVGICLGASAPARNESIADHASKTKFRVVLQHANAGTSSLATWTTEELEIRHFHNQQLQNIQPVPPAHVQASSSVRRARFATDTEIDDLCQVLSTTCIDGCFGYITPSTALERYWMTRLWKQQSDPTQASCHLHTLDALLRHDRRIPRRLRQVDVHQLAPVLAMGMLQLYDTPWIGAQWSKTDVRIVERGGELITQYPFMARLLVTSQAKHEPDTERGQHQLTRNSMLSALAILLIELSLGCPIDRLRLPDDLDSDGKTHARSDCTTAKRLLNSNEIFKASGKPYHTVVERCLNYSYDAAIIELQEAAFRKAVYTDIVVDLEKQRRWFSGDLENVEA